ncbi:hypothetical protein T05_182 [Trichinella murrelli]|uniref:Uncharacterized protein n=1 Tax=Trichinella murrelli TaxID=144512 RepID=A0A0V0TFZ7_9BILA|nr:hypothetical protein T05_182 [Trichinella murrelli]
MKEGRKGVELCSDGRNSGGQGAVGGGSTLSGWKNWQAGIHFYLGEEEMAGWEFRSVIEFSMGGGGIGVRLYNSSWV